MFSKDPAQHRPAPSQMNDLFEAALRTGGLGAWQTDMAAGTRIWTQSAAEIFGFDVEVDVPVPFEVRDHLREVLHPDDRPMLDECHLLFRSQDEIEVEYRIIRPTDEKVRHIHGRGRVLDRERDGTPARIVHIVSDVTERREMETHRWMLMRELTHRTKNQLGVVLAMARQIGRKSAGLAEFQGAFAQRITAMAAGVDALVVAEWQTVPMRTLIATQLQSVVEDGAKQRVSFEGDPVSLDCGAGQALGMALHELATNAVEHGALSTAHGRVEIAWRIATPTAGAPSLVFEWRELGGPPVAEPNPPGFGSTILNAVITQALDAKVTYEMAGSGAVWCFEAPIADPESEGPKSGIHADAPLP